MNELNFAIRHDVDLSSYNSYGLHAIAKNVVYPFNSNGIKDIYKLFSDKKIFVLGNGSNILLTKHKYTDEYLFISMKLLDSLEVINDQIVTEAGVSLNKLVWFAVERGITGFEFLEDIPGSVGGAVIMNAGTYSDNISQLIESVVYFDVSSSALVIAKKEDLDFKVRGSILSFGNKIVTKIQFLSKKRNDIEYLDSINRILEIKRNRYTKQPRNYPSAGSVFKRPIYNGRLEEVWRLVNDVGLRGYRVGNAEISQKHTGFIINLGEATYEDIENLIQIIKNRVYSEYSIILEEEVKRI